MSSNLNSVPPKGILKRKASSHNNGESSDNSEHRSREPKAKFDEMNILETLHPADKDYGHMKIEEPKTPYHYDKEDGFSQSSQNSAGSGSSGLDPEMLAKVIEQRGNEPPRRMSESEDDEDDGDLDPETAKHKEKFAMARKKHYNEFCNVKLARQLIEQEEDEMEDNVEPDEHSKNDGAAGALASGNLDLASGSVDIDNSSAMEYEASRD